MDFRKFIRRSQISSRPSEMDVLISAGQKAQFTDGRPNLEGSLVFSKHIVLKDWNDAAANVALVEDYPQKGSAGYKKAVFYAIYDFSENYGAEGEAMHRQHNALCDKKRELHESPARQELMRKIENASGLERLELMEEYRRQSAGYYREEEEGRNELAAARFTGTAAEAVISYGGKEMTHYLKERMKLVDAKAEIGESRLGSRHMLVITSDPRNAEKIRKNLSQRLAEITNKDEIEEWPERAADYNARQKLDIQNQIKKQSPSKG